MSDKFPIKCEDLVVLTDEWIEWARERDHKDFIWKCGKGEVYRVTSVMGGPFTTTIYMDPTKGIDHSRRLLLNHDLVCCYDDFGIVPIIKLYKKHIELDQYNSKCPICGSPAFDMAVAIECSNSECQNRKR